MVLGGSTFSIVLPIAISPLLTRIYTLPDFALFALYIGFVWVLAAISNSQYTTAILVADTEEDAVSTIHLSTAINGIFFIITLAISFLLGAPILRALNADMRFLPVLWMVPCTVLIMGLYANLLQWSFRRKMFRRVTVSRIFQSLVTALSQIVFGLYFKSLQGMITGYFLGQITSLIALAWLCYRDDRAQLTHINKNNIRLSARKYLKFFIYQTPADIINMVTQQMPTFLLTRFFTSGPEVGWYGFAYRILVAPSSIITGAVGDVFRQKAAADYNANGQAAEVFGRTAKTLFMIMIVPCALVLLAGPWVFAWLFGPEWRQAGVYAQIMIIMLLPKFIASPLSYMYIIARKQNEDFWLHIYILVSTFLSFYLAWHFYGTAEKMLLFFSINYGLVYLVYYIRSRRFAQGSA
jgi:O-antigen/teichoic acid export membrane protein